MNVKQMLAEIQGKTLLTERKGTNKKKGTTRPPSQPRPKSLKIVSDVLEKKGYLTPPQIHEETELDIACVNRCLAQLLESKVVKRHFMGNVGSNRIYSYALITEKTQPKDYLTAFKESVYKEISLSEELKQIELSLILDASAYKLNKAINSLIDEKRITSRKLPRRNGGQILAYRAIN
ncbi:MAG: putative transcriptional regulator [Oceanospirillaceae bacterium]|jgi:predicted transcriptional regulator